jgi:hypothetical protein
MVYDQNYFNCSTLLDGIVYSKLRLSGLDKKNQLMEAVQKQLNASLRVVLGVKISDKVSINELHSMTNILTFNQIAIQSTQRLTWNILNDKSKRLKGFHAILEKTQELRKKDS